MHILRPIFMLLLLLPPPVPAAERIGYPLQLSNHVSSGDQFMQIRLLGAIALSGHKELAELSDLAWDEDEGILYGVTDRGRLLHLRPLLDNGRLIDAELLQDFHLLDKKGKKLKKFYEDAEGLALERAHNGIRGDSLLAVSFEGDNRVDLYSPEGVFQRSLQLPKELRDPRFYKGNNKGLEALARHPQFGYLTAPERAGRGRDIQIFSESGMSWFYPSFEATGALVAMDVLEDGTLIILERAYISIFKPLVITLSSAKPTQENQNSVLQTRQLARFDTAQGWLVQNFEGLAHHRGRRFFMVSDDGGESFLQTQLLYFEIL